MPSPILTPGAVTASTAAIAVANLAADGTLEVQYGARPDFDLCVAPLVTGIARADLALKGLNPGSGYFVRARSRRAGGAAEDWSPTVGFRTADGAARVTAPAAVMIEPAMLVVPAQVLGWTDGGGQVAGYPVANLGLDAPVAWVSKNAASDVHTFIAELGGDKVDTIALLMSNAASDATVTVKAGSTAAGADWNSGALTFRASAALPQRPGFHALLRLPAARADRFWRVEITSANYGRQFQLEHAVFGLNRSTKNHSVDKTESALDLGSLDRTRAGVPIRLTGARMRRIDFDLSVMTEAAYETAYGDLDWRVGTTEPVLCVPNTKANAFLHDRILYGAIRGGKTVNPASPLYTREFTIESIV